MTVESASPNVLALLRPLATAYARRAGPGAFPFAGSAHASDAGLGSKAGPPAALAVLRIDPKGRVSWPRRLGLPGDMVSIRSLNSATIELVVGSCGRGRPIDRRGRIVIPAGVLRTAGAGANDRLIVVSVDGGRYALSVLGRASAVA
jgi:hypothetical protein